MNALAGVNASVHVKLVTSFMAGAVLLLGMAILGIVVLQRMNGQVQELTHLQEQVDRTRQMGSLVTAQSHFRAMALLTSDDANNAKIESAKAAFLEHLDSVEAMGSLKNADFFARLREANDRFAAASSKTLELYEAGDLDIALEVHLGEEHPISHELEHSASELISDAVDAMQLQLAAFESDRRLLTAMLVGFSAVSLFSALLLGFVVSWSFIQPVRKMDSALERIADGDFDQRVDIRNRDEFGTLSQGINAMAAHLGDSYSLLEREKKVSELGEHALQKELDKGRQIQRDFLPTRVNPPSGWEIEAYLSPARDVSGDFYDVFPLPRGLTGIVIADVCDKGVGSALFMALSRSLIRVFSGEIHLAGVMGEDHGEGSSLAESSDLQQSADSDQDDALKAVGLTNSYIARTHGDTNMFATLFFGVLDPSTSVFRYVNAGHESPAVVGADGVVARLGVTGPAVGVIPDIEFRVDQIQLGRGDVLVSYTDGVTDARNPGGEWMTEKGLLALLAEPAASARELLLRIEGQVQAHIGGCRWSAKMGHI